MSRCRFSSTPSRCGGRGVDSQVPDFAAMFHTFHTFHTSLRARTHPRAHARTYACARTRARPTFSVWKVWKVWKGQHPCGFRAPYPASIPRGYGTSHEQLKGLR